MVLFLSSPSPDWFVKKASSAGLTVIEQQIWLQCGLALHPAHCGLQLAHYRWHLSNSPLPTAREHFTRLIKEFPDATEFTTYLMELLALVSAATACTDVEVFNSLNESEQQGVFLTVATSHTDKLKCTSTVLQMMRSYPSSVAPHAISAATVLIQHEDSLSFSSAVNPVRRVLILELVPLLLGCNKAEIGGSLTETVMVSLLRRVIQFYIDCASVKDLHTKEEYKITDCWSDLRETFTEFAKLQGWTIPDSQDSKDVEGLGAFYYHLIAMLEHGFRYVKAVDSLSLVLVRSSSRTNTVEVSGKPGKEGEGISVEEEPARKRRRTVSVTESTNSLLHSFTIATASHRYLQKDGMFERECSELSTASWRWFSLFLCDAALYNSDANLAKLQDSHCTSFPQDSQRILTQQGLTNATAASDTLSSLWKLLQNLPAENTSYRQKIPDIALKDSSGYCLVPNTRSKLSLHVCQSLVGMVRDEIPSIRQSEVLGTLLIIYQFNLDTFRKDLHATLGSMKELKNFKFKGLLDHISHVEVLEELLYLAVHTDVRLDLDKRKRSSKEDVERLLRGHVTSCKEGSEEDVLSYLLENSATIESRFTQLETD